MREKLSIATTVFSAALGLASALSMHDHVRLVDIVTLFFGGVGVGAGLAALLAAPRRS